MEPLQASTPRNGTSDKVTLTVLAPVVKVMAFFKAFKSLREICTIEGGLHLEPHAAGNVTQVTIHANKDKVRVTSAFLLAWVGLEQMRKATDLSHLLRKEEEIACNQVQRETMQQIESIVDIDTSYGEESAPWEYELCELERTDSTLGQNNVLYEQEYPQFTANKDESYEQDYSQSGVNKDESYEQDNSQYGVNKDESYEQDYSQYGVNKDESYEQDYSQSGVNKDESYEQDYSQYGVNKDESHEQTYSQSLVNKEELYEQKYPSAYEEELCEQKYTECTMAEHEFDQGMCSDFNDVSLGLYELYL